MLADAVTRGQLSFNAAATYTFTLQGKSSAASTVTATITSTSDLTSIKDAINAVSGATGITAALTTDKSGINIVQTEGYDVIIGDMSGGTAFYQSMDRNETLDTSGGKRTLLAATTDRSFTWSSYSFKPSSFYSNTRKCGKPFFSKYCGTIFFNCKYCKHFISYKNWSNK